jgi:flavorubredoxin
LAIALVDAATIIIGTPTVHAGPHQTVASAVHLANSIRPKAKYAAIIGSYGWGTKAVEQIVELIPNLRVEMLGTVLCRGYPREGDFDALDELANSVAAKHKEGASAA